MPASGTLEAVSASKGIVRLEPSANEVCTMDSTSLSAAPSSSADRRSATWGGRSLNACEGHERCAGLEDSHLP